MKSAIAPDVRVARWMAILACVAAACSPNSSPETVPPAGAPSTTIEVPDPSFDILVAAADSVVPHFGPPGEKFYVDDSVTAKVLDHAGAKDRYTRITKDQQVSCDGSTPTTGKRASMRVYGLFGDSATVAWSATCLLVPMGQSEARASGTGGTYNLAKTGDTWTVTGAGLLFDF